MAKLTKRTIDAALSGNKDYFLWDGEMPGYGVRVLTSGKKSFLVQYRHGGQTRRKTFGHVGIMTADEARKEARELLAAAGKGDDPAGIAKLYRASPTLGQVCERFMTEHVALRCKSSTEYGYRKVVDFFIKPAIGHLKIGDVTRADVAKLHRDMARIPYQANRTKGILSKLFNLCEVWGLRPDGSNPCRHVAGYKEEKKERFLSPAEFVRLNDILDEVERDGTETRSAVNIIRLLMLTGGRLGEIQTLKWEYVKGDVLELPDTKTGARKVYLGKPAQDVLARAERLPDNPYVITGTVPGRHLANVQRPWRRIRKRAGLEDVRIHDLRHSFASAAIANKVDLHMVGKLLGHAKVQTTARYAHLADDPVKDAANVVASVIDGSTKNY